MWWTFSALMARLRPRALTTWARGASLRVGAAVAARLLGQRGRCSRRHRSGNILEGGLHAKVGCDRPHSWAVCVSWGKAKRSGGSRQASVCCQAATKRRLLCLRRQPQRANHAEVLGAPGPPASALESSLVFFSRHAWHDMPRCAAPAVPPQVCQVLRAGRALRQVARGAQDRQRLP